MPSKPRFAIQHFGERAGLGAVTVITLAQDTQGFLWIGTQNGLYRYDGATIQRFGMEEGLPFDSIDLLVVAPDGAVWAATRKGIARFDGTKFVAVPLAVESGKVRDCLQPFAVDSAGSLYVSTENGLLALQTGGSHRLYGVAEGLASEQIDAIVRGPDDSIWFAAGQKIYRLPRTRRTPELFASLPSPDPVRTLLADRQSTLWIRTNDKIGTLDMRRTGQPPRWLEGKIPPANMFGGPSLDQQGNLMLPTPEGLYRYVGGKWQVIDHSNGLTSSAVFAALEDREGDIWVGLAGAGLDHWPNSHQWSGWTDAEGLPDALVLGVVRDQKSRLWVGTNTALAIWDPGTDAWQTWKSPGMERAGVRQLLLARDGAVWALFLGKGLFRFDTASDRPNGVQVPGSKDWPSRRLTLAPDDSVWAGGDGLLRVIRYERRRFVVEEKILPPEAGLTAQAPSMSPGGILWTGGPGGLSRWKNGQWQHFGKQQGLLSENARNVQAIHDDEAWIGYRDEPSVTRARILPGGRLETTHFRQGSCSFGADRQGNIWLEMQQAVGIVSPDGKLRTVTQADGLLWDDVNCSAFWQEADGSILLGTSKGLARYDPTQDHRTPSPPTVVLTSALLGGQERLQEGNPEVDYRDRTFVVRFAALAFRNPRAVSCKYRLRGLEPEFTRIDLREVRYSALPAGSYAFELSCGSDQVGWSAPISYSFAIRPPWWGHWWSQLALVCLLAALLYGFIRYRSRMHRREKETLEAAVQERSAELAKANRELQETSLRDPLTGVRNRRFFHATIAADASQAIRAYKSAERAYSTDHRDLVFYFVDIDHFKDVNDRYGHDAGDRVLVEFARRLERITRTSDFLIRWGGEEFLLVCRSANRAEAPLLAERVLAIIANTQFEIRPGQAVNLTCSVGWAPFPWLLELVLKFSVDEVLRVADRAMYMAKRRGRNQSVGLLPDNAGTSLHAASSEFDIDDARARFLEICSLGPKMEVTT